MEREHAPRQCLARRLPRKRARGSQAPARAVFGRTACFTSFRRLLSIHQAHGVSARGPPGPGRPARGLQRRRIARGTACLIQTQRGCQKRPRLRTAACPSRGGRRAGERAHRRRLAQPISAPPALPAGCLPRPPPNSSACQPAPGACRPAWWPCRCGAPCQARAPPATPWCCWQRTRAGCACTRRVHAARAPGELSLTAGRLGLTASHSRERRCPAWPPLPAAACQLHAAHLLVVSTPGARAPPPPLTGELQRRLAWGEVGRLPAAAVAAAGAMRHSVWGVMPRVRSPPQAAHLCCQPPTTPRSCCSEAGRVCLLLLGAARWFHYCQPAAALPAASVAASLRRRCPLLALLPACYPAAAVSCEQSCCGCAPPAPEPPPARSRPAPPCPGPRRPPASQLCAPWLPAPHPQRAFRQHLDDGRPHRRGAAPGVRVAPQSAVRARAHRGGGRAALQPPRAAPRGRAPRPTKAPRPATCDGWTSRRCAGAASVGPCP